MAQRSQELNEKQMRFCYEYVADLNATQAVLRAGYNMTETAAGVHGCKLLKNAKVQKRIQELQEERRKTSRITVEWILEQIASIAENIESRDADRLKALELLGKHYGIWEKREDPDANGVKVVLAEAEDWAE